MQAHQPEENGNCHWERKESSLWEQMRQPHEKDGIYTNSVESVVKSTAHDKDGFVY
jgi:hypothetical protein